VNEILKEAVFYGIVDLGYVEDSRISEVCQALVDGGAGVIQLRAKGREKREIANWSKELLPICRSAGVPFIVNDYADVAAEVGADGLHIGQDDGMLSEVRTIVGDEMIVGRSTHSVEQARWALKEGFDYIGFGPLFPTPTKAGRPGIGLENVSIVQKEIGSKIPVFCIGGVKLENLEEVKRAGARRVVVVSDVLQAKEVFIAVKKVLRFLLAH